MRSEESILQEAAEAAERSGDLEAAFDTWRTLSSIAANRPDYLCKSGRVAQKLGRWTYAEQAFLDAMEVDAKGDKTPKISPLAMMFMGGLFLERTDGDSSANAQKAKVWLERAPALSPTPMSLSLLGAAHARLGERDSASNAFRKAIYLDEFYGEAYLNLGLLLAYDGQNIEAERLLIRATQLDPNSHRAHGALGVLLHKQGRYSEAEHELRRTIEISPTDGTARFYLSRCRILQRAATDLSN